nr:hypothetical protein [Ardenticatena sp.]
MTETHSPKKKQRMPTSAYIGSGLVGIAVLGALCWCAAFLRTNALIEAGLGDPANYVLILSLISIFLVGLPLYVGLRLMRQTKRRMEAEARRQKDGDTEPNL